MLAEKVAELTPDVCHRLAIAGRIRQKLEKLYDEFYAEALAIIERAKPCETHTRKERVICLGVLFGAEQPNTLCCSGCQHHNREHGCQADRPLWCKLWLCREAQKHHPVTATALNEIANRVHQVFAVCFRGDRKATIDKTLAVWEKDN